MTSPDATSGNEHAEATGAALVSGGGGATDTATSPARAAAERLALLSEETREQILARMDDSNAEQVRDMLRSLTGNERPHAKFSADLAHRRELLQQTADSIAQRRTETAERAVARLDPQYLGQHHVQATSGSVAGAPHAVPSAPADPLDQLHGLHPAAIARAMQGERAEAWAIVLDRLDVNARAALQLYLDRDARAAIDEARTRQSQLGDTAPALLGTVVAAITRTIVPRAVREHQLLLSTTQPGWAQ